MGFILLRGYARGLHGESVYEGLTVGYCLALTQFVMVFVLGLMYLRKADREFDPLAERSSRWPGRADAGRPAGASSASRTATTPEVAAMTLFAAINVEAVVIFAIVLSITLGITYWASKRATSAVGFYAAGRQITGAQNGLAISGDYLSAASFLGIAGLIFLYGFDGFLYSIGFLVAFLTVMFLLAERMRNAGKYTIADVLAFRLSERPARTAAAIGTLAVVAFYLIAQMVGAGVLIQALVGIDFTLAVILTGAFMLCYVVFGGMVATTWVQIIKAVLLMTGIAVMSIFVLGKVGFNPIELFNRAEANTTAESTFSLGPGTFLATPIDTVSLGLALVLGTAGPAAHPDAVLHRAGRQGGARLGGVGDVPDRLLLPDDHVHRLRRPGVPRRGGRGGGRHRRQPGGAEPRRRSSAAARARSAATCSWPSSRPSRSRRSSRWSPGSCSRPPAPWRTTSGRTSCARARTPRRRRSWSRRSRRSPSARSRSSSRSSAARA